MISKWVHYKLHCTVCKTPIGATVRRRHEPEVEHLCFTCPDPGTPERSESSVDEAAIAIDLLTGRLPMPKGDIACAQIEDAIDEMILGWEDR
jgi:hypothetical protein